MKKLILCLAFLASPVVAHADAPDAGVTLIEPMAGSAQAAGSAAAPVTTAPPSSTLSNPASEPLAAWDDVKAAKKIGWTALVFALATMLAMAIGTLGKNLKQLAWLNKGRTALVVGGIVAVGAAGFDVAAQGGSPIALGLALWSAGLAYYQRATAA